MPQFFHMVSLKKKMIKGHTYWYAVEMARVDGKPKQVWQKYLGTAEKIVELKEKSDNQQDKCQDTCTLFCPCCGKSICNNMNCDKRI